MSETGHDNRPVRLRKVSVRLIGAVLAGTLMAASASFLVGSDAYTPSLVSGLVSAIFVVFFCHLVFRSLRLGVEVRTETVLVRNLIRSHEIRCSEIAAIIMPNETAAQAIPKLRLQDGSDVSLLGLSRTKNRAWGRDRATERLINKLAQLCGVPVVGELEGDGLHWG